MSDGHFLHAGHGLQKLGEVLAAQVVPGIDAHSHIECGLRGCGKLAQHFALVGGTAGARIAFCVQLYPVRADGLGGSHGRRVRVHEQTHPHP